MDSIHLSQLEDLLFVPVYCGIACVPDAPDRNDLQLGFTLVLTFLFLFCYNITIIFYVRISIRNWNISDSNPLAERCSAACKWQKLTLTATVETSVITAVFKLLCLCVDQQRQQSEAKGWNEASEYHKNGWGGNVWHKWVHPKVNIFPQKAHSCWFMQKMVEQEKYNLTWSTP